MRAYLHPSPNYPLTLSPNLHSSLGLLFLLSYSSSSLIFGWRGERWSVRISDGTLNILRFFVVFFSSCRQFSPFQSRLYSLATDSFTKQSINPETSSLYLICYLPNPAIYFPSFMSFTLSSISFYSFSTFPFSVSRVPHPPLRALLIEFDVWRADVLNIEPSSRVSSISALPTQLRLHDW
jgi:hypothetical protein